MVARSAHNKNHDNNNNNNNTCVICGGAVDVRDRGTGFFYARVPGSPRPFYVARVCSICTDAYFVSPAFFHVTVPLEPNAIEVHVCRVPPPHHN